MAFYEEDYDDNYDSRYYDPEPPPDNSYYDDEEEEHPVIISAIPPANVERSKVMADWILAVLATPTLATRTAMPPLGRCVIFLDGAPKMVLTGAWQIDNDYLYVAAERSGVAMFDRLSILAAIAAATGASQDPRIPEAFTNKLVQVIRDSTASLYASIAVSVIPPKRIAVNMANAQVAAELNDRWSLPGGSPAEVDNSWITMDL